MDVISFINLLTNDFLMSKKDYFNSEKVSNKYLVLVNFRLQNNDYKLLPENELIKNLEEFFKMDKYCNKSIINNEYQSLKSLILSAKNDDNYKYVKKLLLALQEYYIYERIKVINKNEVIEKTTKPMIYQMD